MKSPQMMPSGGNKQTGFADEYCRMLIDQELAQLTIRKTLNAFRNLLKISQEFDQIVPLWTKMDH